MKIKIKSLFLLVLFSTILSACNDSQTSQSEVFEASNFSGSSGVKSKMMMDSFSDGFAEQRSKNKYLSYRHNISVDMPADVITATHKNIMQACALDEIHQCTIMHSSVNSGDYPSSNIRLRIKPEGVAAIVDMASLDGEVSDKATDVQDLGEQVMDNKKRLEMLMTYQKRLESLEAKSADDIESLVKIASELSRVQADLEYAQGRKAKLLQRIQMDVVSISLYSRSSISFWKPIADSLSGFGANLSEGISTVIIATAFLIPWLLSLAVIVWPITVLWRNRKKIALAKGK